MQLLQVADETLPQPRREQMLLGTLTRSIEGNYVDPGGDEGHSLRKSDALGKRTGLGTEKRACYGIAFTFSNWLKPDK